MLNKLKNRFSQITTSGIKRCQYGWFGEVLWSVALFLHDQTFIPQKVVPAYTTCISHIEVILQGQLESSFRVCFQTASEQDYVSLTEGTLPGKISSVTAAPPSTCLRSSTAVFSPPFCR